MRRTCLRIVFCVLPLALARGQVRITQDGHLLDANPRVGASHYNAPVARPVSPLLSGNLLATGNARFGTSLRISSPIAAPTAFRAGLGSARLSSFLRDSFSVADLPRSRLGLSLVTPFYDPATNVAVPRPSGPSGLIRYSPLAAQPLSPGLLNYGTPLRPRIRPEPLSEPYGSSTPQPGLNSALFGAGTGPRTLLPDEASRPGSLPRLEQFTAGTTGQRSALPPPLRGGLISLDENLKPQTSAGQNSPDAALSGTGPSELTNPLLLAPGKSTGLHLPEPADVAAPAQPSGPATPSNLSAKLIESMLPGQDVFTDLRLAASLIENPRPGWLDELKRLAREAGPNPRLQQFAQLEAEDFVRRVLSQPIRTFAGRAPSAINDELLKAEGLMAVGRYYDAARHYERAAALDPTNPLPWIGRAHALLAAGEYVSAALSLTRGLERFPDLARFRFDLTSLMGGGEIVDIRRSEIMRLLNNREDHRLRFLLGYLEYHAGNRKLGMENLRRAADEAPIGSIIRRYPDMIEGKSLPPPKFEPASSTPASRPTTGANP